MVSRASAARARDAGLSLVEVLITMIIAGLVAASTFAFFVGQNRVYEAHRRILDVQQNLWSATETLSRFLRMAGTGMLDCVRPDSDGAGADTGDPPPTGAAPPETGLRAFNEALGAIRIAPIWIRNGAAGAPDAFRVAFGTGSFGTYSDVGLGLTIPRDRPTWTLRLPDAVPSLTRIFRANEFVVLLDRSLTPSSGNQDRGCTLMQITGIDPATHTLLHASSSPWNAPSDFAGVVPMDYVGGAANSAGGVRHFGTLNWVEFSIDTAGPQPRLMMQRLDRNEAAQPLAEGIEDLQVAYACDGDPAPNAQDGVFTEGAAGARTNDEWIYNAAGDAPPPRCNRAWAYRLTVVARSLLPDETVRDLPNNRKPAIEDGVSGPIDSFRHRVLTTVVQARN